jgi:hypothetical protein
MTAVYAVVIGSDCLTGKRQFADKASAIKAANAARARGWPTSAYRCQWCECWHTGNPRTSNSKARRRR